MTEGPSATMFGHLHRHCIATACVLLGILATLTLTLGVVADDRPVVIGALYNLTGGQRDLDIPSSQGARLAVDEANAAGGVLGRQVKLVMRDGQTKASVIARETARIFEEEPAIAGLIGLSDTDMVLAAAPVGVTGTISFGNGSRIPAKSVSIIAVSQGRQAVAASVLPEKIPAP